MLLISEYPKTIDCSNFWLVRTMNISNKMAFSMTIVHMIGMSTRKQTFCILLIAKK